MNVLVLESSTTSAKAMHYNSVDKTSKVLTKLYQFNLSTKDIISRDDHESCDENIYYEDKTLHDAQAVYEETMALGKKICEGLDVDIIILSTTWHSLLLCDKEIKPITPCYLWSCTRAANLCRNLNKSSDFSEEFYELTGCLVHSSYPIFKLKTLFELDSSMNPEFILDQGSYMMHKLSGEIVTSHDMASGSGFVNLHTKQYDLNVFKKIGLDIKLEQLPTIQKDSKTYPLTKEGAKQLGLSQGIPIICAHPDGSLNQTGSNESHSQVMTLSVGTSGALRISSSEPKTSKVGSTWCYGTSDAWLIGCATSGACNCIDWMKDKYFDDRMTYSVIENQIKSSQDCPIFLPFIFGERAPGFNSDRLGGFQGLGQAHTPYHLYISVMEGVLFNLYQCYKDIEELGLLPDSIKLSGGILNSEKWSFMCADIFGHPLIKEKVIHASLWGGVVLGAKVLGLSLDREEIRSDLDILYPDMEKHENYKKRYQDYLYWYYKTKE